jgi:hypothetical protein
VIQASHFRDYELAAEPPHNRADWYLESFGNLFVMKARSGKRDPLGFGI